MLHTTYSAKHRSKDRPPTTPPFSLASMTCILNDTGGKGGGEPTHKRNGGRRRTVNLLLILHQMMPEARAEQTTNSPRRTGSNDRWSRYACVPGGHVTAAIASLCGAAKTSTQQPPTVCNGKSSYVVQVQAVLRGKGSPVNTKAPTVDEKPARKQLKGKDPTSMQYTNCERQTPREKKERERQRRERARERDHRPSVENSTKQR